MPQGSNDQTFVCEQHLLHNTSIMLRAAENNAFEKAAKEMKTCNQPFIMN